MQICISSFVICTDHPGHLEDFWDEFSVACGDPFSCVDTQSPYLDWSSLTHSIHVYVIYIYIHIYIYLFIHTHTYIYIYVYWTYPWSMVWFVYFSLATKQFSLVFYFTDTCYSICLLSTTVDNIKHTSNCFIWWKWIQIGIRGTPTGTPHIFGGETHAENARNLTSISAWHSSSSAQCHWGLAQEIAAPQPWSWKNLKEALDKHEESDDIK